MPPLDQSYLMMLSDRLAALGTRVEAGLSDREADAAEGEFAIVFPTDLRQVLQAFLPVDSADRLNQRTRWPNWRDGPMELLAERLSLPWAGIEFDVERTDRWPTAWGPRPASLSVRIETARRLYLAGPRLVPIFAHRYIPADPPSAGNPVFSVHQTDIIYYGFDLVGYFEAEFSVPRPGWAATDARPIRYWDELL